MEKIRGEAGAGRELGREGARKRMRERGSEGERERGREGGRMEGRKIRRKGIVRDCLRIRRTIIYRRACRCIIYCIQHRHYATGKSSVRTVFVPYIRSEPVRCNNVSKGK